LVKPFSELTKKKNDFIWKEECQTAFEKLKQAFVSTDITSFPQDEGSFYLDTAIGAVLSKVQHRQMKVISYNNVT
jgi:hypothetical protein